MKSFAFVSRCALPILTGAVLAAALFGADSVLAQDDPTAGSAPDVPLVATAMTGARLTQLLQTLDPEAEIEANSVRFSIGERMHIVVYDETADRMRLMTPIAPVDVMSEGLMYRMLQANYDSALDARYATAQGLIWSVFVHPLSILAEEFLASAIGQVHTAAETFGTTFSSGELIYGGGDSQEQLEDLQQALDRILNPTT